MKKILFYVVIPLLLIFVFIQFFNPTKNISEEEEAHLLINYSFDTELKEILTNACMDCHSNNTNYLWYHNIAPVSFIINNHIKEGKKELNLSEWEDLDALERIGILDEISDVVTDHTMPLKAYALMHKKAQLTSEEREKIVAWSKQYSEELLREISK